jgi:hypothetical protein
MSTEPNPHDHAVQAGHDNGHATGGHSTSSIISEEEYRQYQRSDLGAGKVVVSLMAGIFSIGLILYTTILIIVLK